MFFVWYVKIGGVFILVVIKVVLMWGVWNFVGIIYDGIYVIFWVNGKKVVLCKINSICLLIIGLIRIGVKNGDKCYFKGVVVCV